MLSSIAINYLLNKSENQNIPVISLYLSHKDSHEQTLSNLAGSLLKQLILYHYPVAPSECVKRLWKAAKQQETRPDLKEFTKVLDSELESFDKVYIVVDALDECLEKTTRNSLLDLLHDILKANVSLMLTSRPLKEIEKIFESSAIFCDACDKPNLTRYYHCTICKSGDFDVCEACIAEGKQCLQDSHNLFKLYTCEKIIIKATEEDLQKYIESKLKTEPRLGSICRRDNTIKDKIIDVIIRVAEGMFLVAKLLMDSLKTKATPKAIRNALDTLPTTLDDIYEDTLKRIKFQCEDDSNNAMKILSWVVHCKRPLTVDELIHALAVCPDDNDLDVGELLEKDYIFQVTAGLLVNDHTRCIRLVHYTTQKYFEKNKDRWFQDAQIDIATTIFTYLNFESLAEPCQGNDEDEKLDARLQKYPFLVYASQHWGDYAREFSGVESKFRKAVFGLVRNPSKLISCVQAAWYSGSGWDVREGYNSLHVCAWFGLDDLIFELLGQGLSIDSQDPTYGQTALMYACKRGHASTTEKLLEYGASINMRSARGTNALFEAILAHQANIVALLLKVDSLDINAKWGNYFGRTALSVAVRNRSKEIIDLLLHRSDMLVNEKGDDGLTALGIASLSTTPFCIKSLLCREDLEVDCADAEGWTPLHFAASEGLVNNVQILLENGADPNIEDVLGKTAVVRAIENGYTSSVQMMICHGANIDHRNRLERTLLHDASYWGRSEIVELLIVAGLEINARGKRGETALHEAATNKIDELVRVLLKNGADPSIVDNEGRTPMAVARQYGSTVVARILAGDIKDENENGESEEQDESEIKLAAWALAELRYKREIEKIVTDNGNLESKNPMSGDDALHYAVWRQDFEILSILLGAGINVDSVNNQLNSALHYCAYQGFTEGTKLLIEHSARLDQKNITRRTPLLIAQDQGHFPVIVELIEAGADIDAGTPSRIQSSFFAAVKLGKVKAVKRLIAHGVDPRALNANNCTALKLAKMEGHSEIIEILQEHRSLSLPTRTVPTIEGGLLTLSPTRLKDE